MGRKDREDIYCFKTGNYMRKLLVWESLSGSRSGARNPRTWDPIKWNSCPFACLHNAEFKTGFDTRVWYGAIHITVVSCKECLTFGIGEKLMKSRTPTAHHKHLSGKSCMTTHLFIFYLRAILDNRWMTWKNWEYLKQEFNLKKQCDMKLL